MCTTSPKAWDPHPNPYWCSARKAWFWFDEAWSDSKPYAQQKDALRDLLGYCRYLEIGYPVHAFTFALDHRPSWWQWFKGTCQGLWHDTRG